MFNLSKLAGLSFILGVVGVLNCLMGMALSALLPQVVSPLSTIPPLVCGVLAAALGIVAGTAFNFFLCRYVVFQDKRPSRRSADADPQAGPATAVPGDENEELGRK